MSVLLTEKAAGGEFSISLLSAAFGGSAVVAGLLAPVVGRRADRHSVRGLTLLGGLAGGIAMVLFAAAREPWHVLVAFWLFLGPAAAMSLYEPAYVAVGQWVRAERRNSAIGILSVVAGLAGPIFVPLTSVLLESFGWRPTSVVLGGIFVVAGVGAATFFPEHRAPHRPEHTRVTVRWARFVSDRRLMYFSVAVVLTFAAMNSVFFHRVAVFEEQGFDVSSVALLAGLSGLLTFPGRYLMPRAASHIAATTLFSIASLGIAASLVFAVIGSPAAVMVAFFVSFSVFFGFLLPTRAVIMNGWYSGDDYGAVMGKQWGVAAIVGGVTPWMVGISRDLVGSYTWPLIVLVGFVVVAIVFNEAAVRRIGHSDAVPG